MTQYVIFNGETMRVHGFVDADEEPVMEGWQVAEMTEPVLHYPEAPKPTSYLTWQNALVWVDPRTLEDAKRGGRDRINASWIEADSTSFVYAGKTIGAMPDDIVRINSTNGYVSLMSEMPPDWPGGWKTKAVEPEYVVIADVATWKLFYTAFVMQGQNNYKHAQILKNRIDAAQDAAEADVVMWSDET